MPTLLLQCKATTKSRREVIVVSTSDGYPRDMVGYGRKPVDPKWPGGARLALQIALNYEGGGELSILHGDPSSEGMLTDIGFPVVPGADAASGASSACSRSGQST
jgi:hypothetical protein